MKFFKMNLKNDNSFISNDGKLSNSLDEISKKISKVLPVRFTGQEEEFRRLLYKVCGDEADFSKIERHRSEICKRYFLILVIATMLITCFVINIVLDDEEIVFEKNGRQYVSRKIAEEVPKNLELVVSGKSKKEKIDKKVLLVVNPKGYVKKQREQEEKRLLAARRKSADDELKLKLYTIGAKDDRDVIKLPKEAGSIKQLSWSSKKDRTYIVILIAGILGLVLVYAGRYERFKREEKKAAESVERELSEFFNKLVLLINAGMVFTSAFEKTVAYGSISNSQSYFYDELWKINQKSKESNASVIVELKKFSKRTENKEFIRVVNVISDNINRGTELVRAMQTESELLSYQRRKRAEERARVAETKLTIPLAMQLLSLILITLAPAMLDM